MIQPRHRDEPSWVGGFVPGDILIRTTNARRFDTSLQVSLDIDSSVARKVVLFTRFGSADDLPWLAAEGFSLVFTLSPVATPTAANPDSTEPFYRWEKVIGNAGSVSFGSNVGVASAMPTCDAGERDCNPMYWIVIQQIIP